MGGLPRELLLAAVATTVLALGVVLLVSGATGAGWGVVTVGLLLDAVAMVLIVRRAGGRGRPADPPMPGMVDRR
ncbi:hypothetical protein [Trujillonella endophytica]|uniref:Uncharacterized protein n=1 Tax=Trujillonella endophytica TaxID=673521 RepID=A0A1H8WMB2_9ACTN|nr:hypothetical protein [Trujillella endophytica]SEP28820.1 hypothetical protein SAMN05660991_04555 [Trujillella endophytica]